MRQKVLQSTVVSLLALTLGEERARTAWLDALRGLGMPTEEQYPRDHVMSVLSALSRAPGTVGVAARVARVRMDTDVPVSQPSPSSEVTVRPAEAAAPPSPRSAVDRDRLPTRVESDAAVDLLPFLAPSLGDEKARDVLHQYAKAIGVLPTGLTPDDATALLESMSQASGLLGVVARLTKARLLLKFPATR